jgi:hypothetical protein
VNLDSGTSHSLAATSCVAILRSERLRRESVRRRKVPWIRPKNLCLRVAPPPIRRAATRQPDKYRVRSGDRIILTDNAPFLKNRPPPSKGLLVFFAIKEVHMSQKTAVEMISRRRMLGILGAGVAFGIGAPAAVLTGSEAEAQTPQTPGAQTPGAQAPRAQTPGSQTPGAQTPGADQRQGRAGDGTERRQERRTDRTKRRVARRKARADRRMARQEGRNRRRMARRPGTTGTSAKGTGPTGTGTTGQGPARQ